MINFIRFIVNLGWLGFCIGFVVDSHLRLKRIEDNTTKSMQLGK